MRLLRSRTAAAGGAVTALLVAACARGDGTASVRSAEITPEAFAAFEQTADPALAVDPATGDLLLTWVGYADGAWNLWFARSGDGGATFTDPMRVNDRVGDVHPHAEGSPRLIAARGATAVVWNNQVEAPTRVWGASDLRFARSVDGGVTWEAARTLQDDTTGAVPGENTFHGATLVGESTFVVAWLDGRERDARHVERAVREGVARAEAARVPDAYADERDPHDGDATIYAAVSHDLGATWEGSNRRVSGGVCPCCRVGLVGMPDGDVVAVWRHHFDTNLRDPAFRSLFDEGVEPLRIHADRWEFAGCPHAGPAVDADADGGIHVVWYTGAEGRMGLHYAYKPADAEGFGTPVPIAVGSWVPVSFAAVAARPGGGAIVAHNVDSEGRKSVFVTGVDASGAVAFQREVATSGSATHPQMAELDGAVAIAWTESDDGVEQRTRLVRVEWEDR